MQAKEYLPAGGVERQICAADIAIIGMACRFPGAGNYEQYWQNIVSQKNCVSEVPSDRWDWREHSRDPRLEPGKAGVRWGGFIEDIDKFDPLFFGIAPNEAAFIDPQHRLFLEAAWHAVEDAGYSIASISGKTIGVYAGVSKNDYAELMREQRYDIAPYVSTGTVHSILVNRVSFLFNLHGRSEPVDTACSSSLVALHNAIRDITSGECEAAIVGGVNALLTPTMFISHSKSGMLSPDGQCKTFSASANGYVRGEGVGVLYIKPLDRALRDGDHVHAVIKSSAINHGGRSNFLTSPSTEAQAAVVAQALRKGGIDPRTVDYIEAHGTGTPLGDPIEINGLKRAFAQLAHEFPGPAETGAPHCALGAVKTNIGHLESAAGMAGIIKVVMAMKHRVIPAIRNFDRLNPYVELDGSPFSIATETAPWTGSPHPRRAGVSSFGMGGVNAHVVLEEAPATAADPRMDGTVLLLSARKGRLQPYAESLLDFLKRLDDGPEPFSLRDIAYTLWAGRDVFDERLAIVAGSVDEVIASLESYVAGEPAPRNLVHAGTSTHANDLAAQWVQGGAVDWTAVFADYVPRRVPLPTYPFARKRCWFTDVVSRTPALVPAMAPAVAPASASDAVRTLRPADFFIRDHVVQQKPTLPGVVHLEFARAAAAQPGALERVSVLKDVYWLTPLVVGSEDVQVDVPLASRNGQLNFEIVQDGTVHSKGSLAELPLDGPAPRPLDIAAIRSRCKPGTTRAALYELFAEHGLAYGSSFQVIEGYVHNEREILAELKLPAEVYAGRQDYVLHPSMMDGVFQAVTALSILGLHHPGKQFVPFHLEAIEILHPIAERCFVHATVGDAGGREGKFPSFNASLADEKGKVLVNVKNLQKRAIAVAKVPEAAGEPMADSYYRPVWSSRDAGHLAGRPAGTLVLFADREETVESFRRECGAPSKLVVVRRGAGYRRLNEGIYEIDPHEPADYDTLLQELKAGGASRLDVAYLWGWNLGDTADVRSSLDITIYAVLRITQAAFKARFHDVTLVHVYGLNGGSGHPLHAMVAGFARTLKYESPTFEYVTLGLDAAAAEGIVRAVLTELGAAAGVGALREVSYLEGRRYERQIVREAVPDRTAASKSGVLKPGGVYVISGGAGGLGSAFSRHFAAEYGATVLWLGRSAITPAITEKIRGIEQAGGTCEYFSVDITDGPALATLFERIKASHRGINGVIHAAGLIEDAFILRKEPGSFTRVVEPKVLGAVNLDAVTKDEPLDFFVMFSSIAALIPNQGQSDYAAANSFLDSFAAERNALVGNQRRAGVSLALNWPLWADGGIRVTAEEERHLFRVFGMNPMRTADGLQAFEHALALATRKFPDIHQLIAIDGDREKIEQCLGVGTAAPVAEEDPASGLQPQTAIKAIFAGRLNLTPEVIDGGRTIGELGVDSSTIIGVIQDINERFGTELNPTLLFDINTVDKLSAYLVGIGKDKVAIPSVPGAARWNRSLIDVDQSDHAARTFRRTFRTSEFYLRDHVVDGQYNMPGACYVEMARQAGDLLLGDGSVKRLLHNYWASPLSSPAEDFTAQVQITAKQDHLAYEIVSVAADGAKQLHAMGQISQDVTPSQAGSTIDLALIQSRCTEIQYPQEIYEQIHGEGLMVGPTFQPMTRIFLNDVEALAMLELPRDIEATNGDYVLHPALLTGTFQAALISNRRIGGNSRQYIPIGMDELEVLAPMPAQCYVYSRPRPANARNEEMRKFDLEVCGSDGVIVLRLKGFSIRALREAAAVADEGRQESAAAPAPAAEGEISAYLASLIAGPIGLPADEIDPDTGFDQYGVTSVMVVELNEIFEGVFGPLSKTLFFEYRNIAELTGYFVEHHRETLHTVLPAKPDAEAAVTPDRDAGPAADAKAVVAVRADEGHDIAIVSMAGRFPGARNLDEFWDVLREGRDCITEIPSNRFDYRKHFDADPEQNRIYGKWGGFLEDVDRFDPTFFNISPREAELIDPQERLLLEVVWEMLERAGYTRQRLASLSDRKVGVFVGALWQPYEAVGIEATNAGNVVGPSSLLYSIANRISYFFDLTGPSMAVDTACSSSLTALHLACQSIRNGESQFAIAAGVNLSLAASKYLFLSQNRFLSTDGRCRSYGAGGDGYVPGEGICALLVKPLARAIADGDSILAVIKGSAINHGGRTNGYTVPNPKAQGNVIAQALEQAGIDPHAITYIEGHGTGTSLGDPIEIDGLEKALGRSRNADDFCAIGSVKSNIGHLEAAAGIASTIKVILQMQHGQLAPSLHAEHLNPNINFGSLFRVQRALGPWPHREILRNGKAEPAPRSAGVSSFGAGGSNAHVILEEYDGPRPAVWRANGPALCVFSARDEERLVELIRGFESVLRHAPQEDIHAIAYTLQLGREAMRERFAIVASSIADLHAALVDFLGGSKLRSNARLGRVPAPGGQTKARSLAAHPMPEGWWRDENLLETAEAWVNGQEPDWTRMYGGRNYAFLPLPTYPFADERYWLDTTPAAETTTAVATIEVLHPLLHRNTSDLTEQRYSSSFSGDEFFLADHRVRTGSDTVQRILPGVAHLEIVRTAVEHALPAPQGAGILELLHTGWSQPIVVNGTTRINIALSADQDDQLDYEIYSEEGETELVHSQGRAAWSRRPAPAPLDLDGLRLQMQQATLGPDDVYAPCARTGLVLGPSFRAVTAVHLGDNQLLAYVRLPEPVQEGASQYVLHPSMMDGALHASIGFLDGWTEGSDKPRLPFALELLRVISPCTREMVAWMRHSPGSRAGDVAKLDVDLCDERGNVCVQMHGFSSRVLSGEVAAVASRNSAMSSLLATPIWQAREAMPPADVHAAFAEHHVILCELPGIDPHAVEASLAGSRCFSLNTPSATIAARYVEYSLAAFARIQAILLARPAGNVLMQLVIADEPEQALFAGLSGLLRTAALENPQFLGQVILVPAAITSHDLSGLLRNERAGALDALVRYRDGARQVSTWQELPDAANDAPIAFQDGGVYLITGGLGGLGVLFAKEILASAPQARVILTGRSAATAETRTRLEALAPRTAGLSYRQVDLGDREQVTKLIAAIQDEHGQLNGILHCAGMIADSFLFKKESVRFAEVLAPKVTGTFHLDSASRDVKLDFLVLFSSIAAAMGNPGQADYAAANGFMDRFAEYRNRQVSLGQRHGRTRSIAWPLWQAGGMGIDAASQELLQQTTGMHPMQAATGLAAFHRGLALSNDQLLVMEGDLTRMRQALFAGAAVQHESATAVDIDTGSLSEKTQDYLRKQLSGLLKLPPHRIDPQAALEEYGIDSILAMKLTSQLEKTFGSLPKTLFFEYQTIREVAEYIRTHHPAQLALLLEPAGHRPPGIVPAVASPVAGKVVSSRRFSRLRGAAVHTPPADADRIAIIGLSGRYPQAADMDTYWKNLREGKDCITEVPKERWDWREYFSDDRRESGSHFSKWGGFIDGVDEFDPLFFNISPSEAELIDPQERLFLQHAWAAVEDAGYTRAGLQVPSAHDLPGQVGVYAGVWSSEYQLFGAENSLRGKRMGFAVSIASIANRVSYALNLHGPSMALDTMCSSSLTAIHIAIQDLKQGRTSLAIAGGVNVSIHPNKYLMLSAAQAISSDGHCRSFGEGGDGYIPAEGVGVVVLKRLADAERDGDHIYGVIRGSALSHGGKTNGYTVPNPQAQTSAISRALAESGVEARHVSYLETHGTGTKLGDPIEIAALNKAFRQTTQDTKFCPIGSVKSNIGHCESAAGVAGLTKILLQMQQRELVPSLHSAQLNPHIDFGASPFVVNQVLRPWEQPVVDGRKLPRIAGVSSFGAGGSNAHLIVEEYDAPVQQMAVAGPVIILLSARTAEQLERKAAELLQFVQARIGAIDLAALAYTLQVGREAMDERLGFIVTSIDQLADTLHAYGAGEQGIENLYRGRVKRNDETLSLFSADVDLQQTIDQWIVKKKLPKLLDLWVRGMELDWSKLYGQARPQRISLPTYPFAKDRYWIETVSAGDRADAGMTVVLHPLLHRNTSNFLEQRFSTDLRGDELFLTDHMVKGAKVLPAVCYLEMGRAAVMASSAETTAEEDVTVRFRNVTWTSPILVDEPRRIHIGLSNEQQEIEFQIYSDGTDGDPEVIHGSGQASAGTHEDHSGEAPLDWPALRARCDRSLDAAHCYAAFAAMGIEYGAAHRGIVRLDFGRNAADESFVLAEVRLPESAGTTDEQYVLHPGVMDAALQASMGFSPAFAAAPHGMGKPSLPFHVEEVEIRQRTPLLAYVYLRASVGARANPAASAQIPKLDIDLCDERGRVCVRLKGFTSRVLERNLQPAARSGATAGRDEASIHTVQLVPCWDVVTPPPGLAGPASGAHILLVGGTAEEQQELRLRYPDLSAVALDAHDLLDGLLERVHAAGVIEHVVWLAPRSAATGVADDRLIGEQSDGVLGGLRLIQALLRLGYGTRDLGWTVATWQTQPVARDERIQPAHASIHGLIGSLAKEYARWSIRLADLPIGEEWPLDALLRLPADAHGNAWAYRAGEWYRQQLLPCDLPATQVTGYRQGGVYVVIGGAGGIGETLSEYLIRKYQARMIWIGRRELDAEIQAKLDRLGALGPVPMYVRADATDRDELGQAYQAIRAQHGRIHGVVHAAIALFDRGVAQMDAARFTASLAAKVDVSVRMAQVFEPAELDFVLFFSSLVSFARPAGQSNYSAGCTFEDAFAHHLSAAWPCPVKVMNWGYWGEQGIVAAAAYRERMAQHGIGSIEPDEGMAALEQLLAAPMPQLSLYKGRPHALAALTISQDRITIAGSSSPMFVDVTQGDTPHARLSA